MKTTKQLAWFHFKFRIPVEWEITAYSVEDRTGRLEFSTHKGFQALVGWQSCDTAPSVETMMLSFLRGSALNPNRKEQLSVTDLKTRTVGRFLTGHVGEGFPLQAICYLEKPKKLLHWVFDSYDQQIAEDMWFPILQSFEPNDGDVVQYAIFGLNFGLPGEYALEDMTVLPANVMIAFESAKTKARATFRRWGMPEVVLQGRTLEEFYPWFLRAQGSIAVNVEKSAITGMEAIKASYEHKGEHQMDKFMGRPWKSGEAWLWHDKVEMRIYSFEQIAPPRMPLLRFHEVFPGLI
jgi:hypothetical protein